MTVRVRRISLIDFTFRQLLGTLRSRSSRAASSLIQTTSQPASSSPCSTRTFSAPRRGCSSTYRETTTTAASGLRFGAIWSASGPKCVRGRASSRVDAGDEPLRVGLESGAELEASALVLATDPATLRRLVLESELGDEGWRARVAATGQAPPFAVWRLWLDRLVALDRPAFLGTSGFGPLDNISVLERFEDGAHNWSAAHGGSVVELHAYALVEQPDDDPLLKDRLLLELHRIYPELKEASIIAEEWLINEDCPLLGTDPWEQRLTVDTPHPRIVLAGDGIRCDFPVALMERAATTGFLAANQLLYTYGLAGHDLWTVPVRSRHRLAARLHRLTGHPGQPGNSPRCRSS